MENLMVCSLVLIAAELYHGRGVNVSSFFVAPLKALSVPKFGRSHQVRQDFVDGGFYSEPFAFAYDGAVDCKDFRWVPCFDVLEH